MKRQKSPKSPPIPGKTITTTSPSCSSFPSPATNMPPITPPSSSYPPPSSKPRKSSQNANPNPQTYFLCKDHPSPSATLDLLILLLVLFSSLFLISSILSYLSISLSLLLPSINPSFLAFFLLFFIASLAAVELCCGGVRGRRCRNPKCRGMKKAAEFDVQLQTEECLRVEESRREIDDLPWKGGAEGNPDYECLIKELRRLAPANGRAVLLFRAKCGCALAKLEAWGAKRGRRHRRNTGTLAIENGDR